jgi:hypothetical protein
MAEQLVATGASTQAVFESLGQRTAEIVEQTRVLVSDLRVTMERFAAAAANLQNVPQNISASVKAVAQTASATINDELKRSAAAVTESFNGLNDKLAEINAIPAEVKQAVDSANKEILHTIETNARVLNERLETLASRQVARAASVGASLSAGSELRPVKEEVRVKTTVTNLSGTSYRAKSSTMPSRFPVFDRSRETNTPEELVYQRKWYDLVLRPLRWLRRYSNG